MVGSKAHDFIKQILPQWWARVLGSGLLCCLGGLGLGSPEIEKNQLIWFLIFTQPKTSTNLTQTNIQTNTSNACWLRYWLLALTATGALARTMGRAKAETTMPVVRNQASSRQGFDLMWETLWVFHSLDILSLCSPWRILSTSLGDESGNWR